ncbi:hypothetical protein BKA70DRAFT_1095044 [Coprinopsis sp. MPI-PUGE-AT-0042]|nr:hypothetical protein BKA70DRAFT_1095044 [Coprinopsis sp. MPI-PUGE-AT-0042]
MQQFREPRSSYPYDDQATAYATAHTSHHTSEYSLTTPAYPHYDSGGFYPSGTIAGMGDAHTSSYYRAMTPSLSHARYPSTSRDSRYFSGEPQVALSSSHNNSSLYSSNNGYLPPTFGTNNEARTQFIPTPSEMANTYSNYGMVPRSPPLTGAERYSSPTAYPNHLMASSNVWDARFLAHYLPVGRAFPLRKVRQDLLQVSRQKAAPRDSTPGHSHCSSLQVVREGVQQVGSMPFCIRSVNSHSKFPELIP